MIQTATKLDSTDSLPHKLGNGLILRWATPADAEALVAFNGRIFSNQPDQPDEMIAQWTRDLLSGRHPTTGPDDFTLVVDEEDGGRIVSSLCLISQQWSYEDIPFGMGRIEIVGTDPAYRRRGLVREQFDAIHARSAARGAHAQCITGIPWYYRQFGYEMALELGGDRTQHWHRLSALSDGRQDLYRLRRATLDDIPLLSCLYDMHRATSMVTCLRDEANWRWELAGAHERGFHYDFWIVEDLAGTGIAFAMTMQRHDLDVLEIYAVATLPGHALRAVCGFLGRALKAQAEEMNKTREKPITALSWSLGTSHPAYNALGEQLERLQPPYAWYLRVADVPCFLRHIAPVLERRLAGSVLDGYSGTLRLSFYRSHLTLVFDQGRLVEVGSYTPTRLADGDALFPDHTFLQLLFGHRSMIELNYARPDCFTRGDEPPVLLDVLFPRRPSCPLGIC